MAKENKDEIKPLNSNPQPPAETPPKSVEEERAELQKLREELAAERKLLDEEMAELELSQQAAANSQLASDSKLPPTLVHIRDVPKNVAKSRDELKAWLKANNKKAVVRDYEVRLLGGKNKSRTVSPVTAIDESEAISKAFASRNIEGTQAYNPIAREIVA